MEEGCPAVVAKLYDVERYRHRCFIWSLLRVSIGLVFFAFYPPATSLVDQVLISYSKDVVGPIFTGLGGAMLGAFAAYAFQKNSEATREFNDSLRVLRIVKFQLLHKLSELVSVKNFAASF